MDWDYYSSGPKTATVNDCYWSGPPPDIGAMVENRDFFGLINALNYSGADIRRAAVEGLARLGASGAFAIVHTLMDDRNPLVRNEAYRMWKKHGGNITATNNSSEQDPEILSLFG